MNAAELLAEQLRQDSAEDARWREQRYQKARRRQILKLQGELMDLRLHCISRGADPYLARTCIRTVLGELKRIRECM